MSAPRPAGRLSTTQQSEALSEWGRAGSFRCCGCDAECAALGVSVPTLLGFHLGACHRCASRMRMSPGFRRLTRERAQNCALRALYQRAADLVGVTGSALCDAMPGPLGMPDPASLSAADVRLNLPLGSLGTAVAHVLGVGQRQ